MKTWKIVHKEELIGWFYVEAETAEEAIEQWRYKVDNEEVNFSDMEMVSSEDTVEEW